MTAFETPILLVAGVLTSLLGLQFVFPRWYSQTFNALKVESDAEVFFARQGGLAIAAQGILLIVAGFVPEVRGVAIWVVGGAKLVFVSYLWLNLGKLPGMLVTALIDSTMVISLGALLFR